MPRRDPSPLISAVARFFEQRPFLRGRRLLAAVSGGADSVALLHCLRELAERFGLTLAAAHFNHGLRGEEASRDEAFVRSLCASLDLPLRVGRTRQLLAGSNLEERARQARYEFLAGAARATGSDHVALAHHADDQAETVMLRLLRGSGTAGLGAMAEVGPGNLIRPLLGLRRAEVLDYLARVGTQFIEDSSNAAAFADRNRLRHQVIPLLEREFRPGLARRLSEMAREMRDVQSLLDSLAADFLAANLAEDGSLLLPLFARQPPALARAVLRAMLRGRMSGLRRIERSHVESLLRLCEADAPNGAIDLPGGWRARRQYGKLILEKAKVGPARVNAFDLGLAAGRTTTLVSAAIGLECTLLDVAAATMPRSQCEALFDPQALVEGLRVRNFHPGDRIVPLGMKGSRKLKDVFIEHRIPRDQRPLLPVVVMGEQVVWLPGLVRSNTALVGARTRQVLQIRAVPGIAPNLTPVLAST